MLGICGKKLIFQPKFVALPKHHQSPINGHHSNTNNDPSKAVAEWMEATKGDIVFNALIQKSLEGPGSSTSLNKVKIKA